MTTEIWRVVDPLGGVREVPVRVEGERMYVGAGPGPRIWPASTSPRFAVTSLAMGMRWTVREILAPEESQRAGLLGGLLAVIHRDGGHHCAQYGVERSTGDAVRRVLRDREAAVEAVAAERARCAAVCRKVAAGYDGHAGAVARQCAEAIERGAVGT